MIKNIFPWKRFWCAPTGTISFDDDGFFVDPESKYARYYHKGVVAFEEIRETPCLILLGQPGIGKTITVKSEFDILKSQIRGNGGKLIYTNLNEYSDESRLIRDIFESPTIQSWQGGQHHLHLFLDSLDECLLEINTLAIILRNQFHKFKEHASRLNLRISCRTTDFPEILKDEFDAIWGEDNVETYELAPLLRKDVEVAAKILELDSSSFIEAIKKKEIQSLASNPITLKFLLEEFKNKQQFPDTRPELFLRGCEHLCTENNPERLATQKTGTLSTAKRLALASRIAAVMTFCNRTSVCLQENILDYKETDLTLQMLQEGDETSENRTFSFVERDLREVIQHTGLFSSRGPCRFGFAHQSYAEFLAARYLSSHQLPIRQIKSLIFLSSDPDQMAIPQLKETTAWLCSIMPEVFKELIKSDPQSILLSDVISMEYGLKKDLVSSLLRQFEQQRITDTNWRHYSLYNKLKHPDIDTQLKPYIKDKTKHFLVRRVAIKIAGTCKIKSLQNLLADVTLDHLDNIHIRDQAAHAVSLVADYKTLLRLKPLVIMKQEDDKDDQLKGCALRALWPKHLSTQELFDVLTPPKNENFHGSYAGFILDFAEQLKINDLHSALKWVSKISRKKGDLSFTLTKLSENILFCSLQHIDKREIIDVFAEAIIPKLDNYLDICPIPNGESEDKVLPDVLEVTRKNLIRALVKKINIYKSHMLVSPFVKPQILFDYDLEWLINELKTEKAQKRKKIWIEIIHDIFKQDNLGHIELISQAMRENQQLADKFRVYFDAVEINSPLAEEMRMCDRKYKEIISKPNQNKVEKQHKIIPSIHERIKTSLDQFENGDSYAWVQLCNEMARGDDSEYYENRFNANLMSLPGWTVCDRSVKERIVNAGKKYILENDANTHCWLKKNSYYPPAMAGYKVFVILDKLEPEFLNNLSNDIWKNWVSIIIAYPNNSNDESENNIFEKITKQAYQKIPKEFIDTLLVLIDKENKQFDHLYIIRKIINCLDKRLQEALLNKAKDASLKSSCFQDLISYLLMVKDQKTKSYAESLLKLPLSKDSKFLNRAKASALALLAQADDAGWHVIWAAIQEETAFGKDVLMSMPDSFVFHDSKNLPDRIGEESTAELFIWLNKNFPRLYDPDNKVGSEVSSREKLSDYRESLLHSLVAKGTPEAIRVIERIQKELPEFSSLNFYLVNARENMRRVNWEPLSPDEFLSITTNPSSRLILNAEHLLEAIIESLKKYEMILQGENPTAYTLWDERPNKMFKPKPEKNLSNSIKVHLTEDLKQSGVLINREVVIKEKHGKEGSSGEELDIYVAVFIPSKQEHVRVFIEVKGCWHKEVNTAMKTQLLNRYLSESGCDHGIYLVGWFLCDQWEMDDNSKNRISEKNIKEAKKKFATQALRLSTDKKKIKSFVLNCALR